MAEEMCTTKKVQRLPSVGCSFVVHTSTLPLGITGGVGLGGGAHTTAFTKHEYDIKLYGTKDADQT